MLSAKQDSIKYNFWVFGMTQPGIEPWSPEPLANTLLIKPMPRYFYKFYTFFNGLKFVTFNCNLKAEKRWMQIYDLL